MEQRSSPTKVMAGGLANSMRAAASVLFSGSRRRARPVRRLAAVVAPTSHTSRRHPTPAILSAGTNNITHMTFP